MAWLQTLHFLRPEWFWALLPLLLMVAWLARRGAAKGGWQTVIDPALQPYMLIGEEHRRRMVPSAVTLLAGLLAITALAGPVWQKVEQPLFRHDSSLVILLDLSRSMDASDTRPSRLARARLKIKDILERRHEGETALIAYAATPFVVTPLTDDGATIASQLNGLATGLMPVQGSRPDLALAQGRDLLHQAGRVRGSLLLVTDGIDGSASAALQTQIRQLRAEGFKLLILGVGSGAGAPIPLEGGGFVKDRGGNIVLARLDSAALQAAAQQGGGLYRTLANDEGDIDALLAATDSGQALDAGKAVKGITSDQWQEEGPWLLLPLLLLSLFAFRRGVLLVALVVALPLPREGLAASLDELWQSHDQQAQQAFNRGENRDAAALFDDPAWRAAAHYRNGDYQQALDDLSGVAGGEAAYNRGNALAQLGKLEEAVKAYDEALKLDPHLEDAAYNRSRVEQWLKEAQQQDKPPSGEHSGQGDNSDSQEGEQGDNKPGDSSAGNQQGSPSPSQQGEQDNPGPAVGEDGAVQKEAARQKAESTPGDDAAQQAASETPRQDDGAAKEQSEQATAASSNEQGDVASAEQQAAQQLAEELAKGREEKAGTPAAAAEETPSVLTPEQREQQQATEQWLRRIPDDPSGLWRRKFLYQYNQQQQSAGDEEKPW